MAVVGSVNLDLVAGLARLPEPGETLTATGLTRVPGGKGANQALAARRLGLPVRLVAAVGTDPEADTALELLRSEGVELGGLRRVAEPTGLALIAVDDTGETTIIVVPGANATLRVRAEDVAGADAVLTVLEVPDHAVTAAAQHATGLFVLNAAPARPIPPEVLRRADLVVVNSAEYAALPGLDAARAVAITDGPRGAVLFRDGRQVAAAAPPPVHAVDGTGAGDAFVGAAVAGLLTGLRDADLLARACAAGALAATRRGAQPSLPTATEIDEVLAR
ncbi:MAG TPA: PfkB family carbohydrate kinase [Pseudonocardiaceae bacterium]|nr:PfkB family carbohydrate kinase [Pseudonocardiaceae bacterium]